MRRNATKAVAFIAASATLIAADLGEAGIAMDLPVVVVVGVVVTIAAAGLLPPLPRRTTGRFVMHAFC